jgi:hypothetical protein
LLAEIEGVVLAMTMVALAKLEANAPDIARMLRVFANERRVDSGYGQRHIKAAA